MFTYGGMDDPADVVCMSPMQIEYPLGHFIRALVVIIDRTTYFAITREESDVLHPGDKGCRADIRQRKLAFRTWWAWASHEVDGFFWIIVLESGSENCETSVDALRAPPTVWVHNGHFVHVRAAARFTNKPSEAMAGNFRH